MSGIWASFTTWSRSFGELTGRTNFPRGKGGRPDFVRNRLLLEHFVPRSVGKSLAQLLRLMENANKHESQD
jgi:hypothetical protein